MKKSILYFAAAAALLSACSKEAELREEVVPAGKKVITIQAAVDPESRTGVDMTTGAFSWTEGETIAVIENNQLEAADFTVSDVENGLFKGTVSENAELLGAVSPAAALTETTAIDGDVVYSLSLSGYYAVSAGTNAVMVAGAPKTNGEAQKFNFKHAAALLKLTYENVPAGAQQVRVTMDKPITGTWEFDSFSGVELTNDAEGGSNEAYAEAIQPAKGGETMAFYVPIPTGTYNSLEIALLNTTGAIVEGSVKKVTRELKVERADVLNLPVVKLESKNFVKVTSTSDIVNGTYLIVYEGDDTHSSVAFNGGRETLDAAENGISVTINDNQIAASEELLAASFTLSADDGTLQAANGQYIGVSSNSNGLKTSDKASDYTHTFSIDEKGNAVITASFNSSTMTLRYNYASDNLRFRYYKSGQQPVALYFLEGSETASKKAPELSFEQTSFELTLGDEFTAPTLINPYNLTVSYSTSNENVALVDETTGYVLLGDEAGTAVITASFAGNDEYKADSASYTIVVKEPAATIATILADKSIDTNGTQKTVDNVTVLAGAGNNYVIGDATDIMLLYTYSDLTVGSVVNLSGTVKIYNGVYEFASPAITSSTGSATAAPEADEIDADVLPDYISSPFTWRVSFDASVSTGAALSVGNQTFKVFDQTGKLNDFQGKGVQVSGYLIGYYERTGIQFILTDIAEDPNIPAMQISEPLKWEADEYGADNAKTFTIQLNEAATGYDLTYTSSDDWYVSDNGKGEISVYPTAANDKEEDKTLDITVTHKDDASLSQTIRITQAHKGGELTNVETQTITLSEQGYSNADEVSTIDGTNFSISFDKGSSSNAPKYYNTGAAVRVYGGNNFTVTVDKGYKISTIKLTFASGEGSNTITVSAGDYENGTWTGSLEDGDTLTFTIGGTSGHRRISAIQIN